MRAKSFSAEKRKKQDQQAFLIIGVLLSVAALGLVWHRAAPYCWGGLQGVWAPLLIITLRYLYRVISGRRRDAWALLDALFFAVAFVTITVRLYPHDVWHAAIILLCLISTVIGVQRFRLSPVFMFLNCLLAGFVLL